MKRHKLPCIVLAILLLLFLYSEGCFSVLEGTINTYIISHKTYQPYIHADNYINAAIHSESGYENFDYKDYFTKKSYNQLSLKTKSNFSELKSKEIRFRTIYQEEDKSDHSIIYIDGFLYQKYNHYYLVSVEQVTAIRENNSWKIIEGTQPVSNDWYGDNISSTYYPW